MTPVRSEDSKEAAEPPTLETQRSAAPTPGHKALLTSEQQWRMVFDTDLVGIATFDIGGNYTTANAAFQRMVGYAETEI